MKKKIFCFSRWNVKCSQIVFSLWAFDCRPQFGWKTLAPLPFADDYYSCLLLLLYLFLALQCEKNTNRIKEWKKKTLKQIVNTYGLPRVFARFDAVSCWTVCIISVFYILFLLELFFLAYFDQNVTFSVFFLVSNYRLYRCHCCSCRNLYYFMYSFDFCFMVQKKSQFQHDQIERLSKNKCEWAKWQSHTKRAMNVWRKKREEIIRVICMQFAHNARGLL